MTRIEMPTYPAAPTDMKPLTAAFEAIGGPSPVPWCPKFDTFATALDKSLTANRARWTIVATIDNRYVVLSCRDIAGCPHALCMRDAMMDAVPELATGFPIIIIDTFWSGNSAGVSVEIYDGKLKSSPVDSSVEGMRGPAVCFKFDARKFSRKNQFFFSSGHPNHPRWGQAGKVAARYSKNAGQMAHGVFALAIGTVTFCSYWRLERGVSLLTELEPVGRTVKLATNTVRGAF